MKKEKCLYEAGDVIIFSCSGGLNVVQPANETTKRLTRQGFGSMYCLAGIGGHISGFEEVTREVKKIVAIDGCTVHCTRKTLEHANCPIYIHIAVADLGINKTSDFLIDNNNFKK